MSGHSKWSTIKHQKEATDKKRGQIFTKLGKMISIAAKEGGADLETNFKLRLAVDKAKQANMPKVNIQRAIDKGSGQGGGGSWLEVTYEGYGPEGIAVMVEAATDNKNRTVAEIKKIFERAGGSLGQSGSVSFQFDRKGSLMVEKQGEEEKQILTLMDLAVEDVGEEEEGIEVVVEPKQLFEIKKEIEKLGFKVKRAELVFLPKNMAEIATEKREKVIEFLERLDDLDDVQNVFSNAEL